MEISDMERAVLSGASGEGPRRAMELVVEAGRMLGADRLVPITCAHIDCCIYFGDAGVLWCEALAGGGARVAVPATTNVGALNLLNPEQSRLSPGERRMAYRLMMAHERMGCRPSWTCAPYQAGMRPSCGEQVAWGESNAVAFANTVLGARTNRYGDFLDIACAIAGRAPHYGLHVARNRVASMLIDIGGLPDALRREAAFYPVLGSLIGRLAGDAVCVVDGVPPGMDDDRLKAMCAGAASTGAVALIHVAGTTPEAPDVETALGGEHPRETARVTPDMIRRTRDGLSTPDADRIDCVALGSPHFSDAECRALLRLAEGRSFGVPVYVCAGRHTLEALATDGADDALRALGIEFVVDTCIAVTPILPERPGVMMTNSSKFAHYATGTTGHSPVFGSLGECVASARTGRLVRDPDLWG